MPDQIHPCAGDGPPLNAGLEGEPGVLPLQLKPGKSSEGTTSSGQGLKA